MADKSLAVAFAEAWKAHDAADRAAMDAGNRLRECARRLALAREPLEKIVGQNIRRRVLATGTSGEVVVVTWNPPLTSGNPIITVDLEEVLHEG